MRLNNTIWCTKIYFNLVQTGVLVFLLTFITSSLLYKNYNYFGQFISELGIGETAFLFNLGLIISSVLLLPLALVFWKKRTVLYKASAVIVCISFFAMLCIGIFPMGQEPMHFYSALIFFALISLAILITGIIYSINKESKMAVFSFVSFFIVVTYLVNNYSALLQKVSVLFILIWVLLQTVKKEDN